ncbi:MAG: hypothetical protein ACRC33_25760, partial [Gemmataceae bacterium]
MRLILGAVLVGLAGCAKAPAVVGPADILVADEAKPAAAEPFQLPADAGGKLLAKVLPPAARPGTAEEM